MDKGQGCWTDPTSLHTVVSHCQGSPLSTLDVITLSSSLLQANLFSFHPAPENVSIAALCSDGQNKAVIAVGPYSCQIFIHSCFFQDNFVFHGPLNWSVYLSEEHCLKQLQLSYWSLIIKAINFKISVIPMHPSCEHFYRSLSVNICGQIQTFFTVK